MHWEERRWRHQIAMGDTFTPQELVKVSNELELSQTWHSNTRRAPRSTETNTIG